MYDFDPHCEASRRPTCQALPTPSGSPGVNGLCRACSHNQTIIVQLLSSFDPPAAAGSFEQMAAQYRQDLERRYPLCPACKYMVDQKLGALSLRLKTRSMARAPGCPASRVQQIEAAVRDSRARPRLRVLPAAGLLFDLAVLVAAEAPCVPRLAPHTARLAALLALYGPSVVGALGLLGLPDAWARASRAWCVCLVVALTGLRLAHQAGVPSAALGRLAYLVVLAMDLSLLLAPPRTCASRPPAPAVHSPPDPRARSQSGGAVPMAAIQGAHGPAPSPSKSIVRDIEDLDWGLGSPSPHASSGAPNVFNPPPATSAPPTGRRIMLQPSRLDASKAILSVASTPVRTGFTAVPPPRPSVLMVEQPSGLESVLGRFSLRDGPDPAAARPLPALAVPELGLPAQVGLTGVSLVLRILARDRTALHTLLLVLVLCWRGAAWPHLPPAGRQACVGLVALRLACVAAQLAEPEFARMMAGSLGARLLCLFLDLGVLAVR